MKELLKIKQVRWLLKALPHVSVVISGMLIVFFCIDRVNKPMAFMTNEFHKVITFILALLSLGYSIFIMSYQRRMERLEHQQRIRAAQARRQNQRPAQNARPVQAQRPVQPRPAQGTRPAAQSVRPSRPMQGR